MQKYLIMGLVKSKALIGTIIILVIGVLATFYYAYNKPDTVYPAHIVTMIIFIIVILFYLIVSILITAISEIYNSSNKLPKVLNAFAHDKKTICLIENSILFSYENTVGIYYKESNCEKLIAIGKVSQIQDDKNIQIEIVLIVGGFQEKIIELGNQNKNTLDSILIKPTVSLDTIISLLNLKTEA